MVITDWALEDRPREKMMANGEDSLTDAELLAILINTGQKGKTAVDIAREILQQCHGDLETLHYQLQPNHDDAKHMQVLKGIGPAKGCTIRAALELGRRMETQRMVKNLNAKYITSSEAIFAQFNQQMTALDHEELWAIYTSKNGKVLHRMEIGVGGTDSASADVKKICRPAIQYMASGVALCHNHPHSNCRPSRADRELTEVAQQALLLFGVKLLDHVIIADGKYYSFKDNGDI